jgi:hypothetical protein
MASYIRISSPEADGLGGVLTDIVVLNGSDRTLAEYGHRPPESVRRIEARQIVVTPDATTLCLPKAMIELLGLRSKGRVMAETASGETETELFSGAYLVVAGREALVECVALPDGSQPLLGTIPLAIMGLEPDVATHELCLLPFDTSDTYIRA